MLRPKKKLTRKELKKDPVLEKISQAENFLRDQSKLVTYAAIGIVVVIALVILLTGSKKKANTAAMGDLGLAEMSYARGDYDDAILRLENLIDKYSSTRSAGMGTVLLAKSYLSKNDYENARVNFERYINDYKKDGLLTATAYSGLAICAEQTGEYQKAAEYFKKGGKVAPYKFQKHSMLLNAARNYLRVADLTSADKMVATVLEDEPETKNKNTAEMLAAQITAQKG
jgi:tetratricopeptide (TPR) repeat protein